VSENTLKFALSPCPNDTFVVAGILQKKVPTRLNWYFEFEDIETLNLWAIEKRFPLIKASFGVWGLIKDTYWLLPVGAALGFGVGPVLVGKKAFTLEEFPKLKVAIPGKHTTAHMLFNFFYDGEIQKVFLRYDEVIPAIKKNQVDMGILIHEGRFAYQKEGLNKLVDLGEFWEKKLKAPLPLGGYFLKRKLTPVANQVVEELKASMEWGKAHFEDALPVLKKFATEMEEGTIKQHVFTFVTEYTFDLLKPEALKGLETFKELLKVEEPLENLIWGLRQ